MKRFTVAGVTLSVVWVAFFAWLIYFKRQTLDQLTLNEWGDFFAGFMAPLALVWLVLGYLQQGEELRLNTEALRLQQDELQNQVRETAALAKHAARQAEASETMARAAQRQLTDRRMERIRSQSVRRTDTDG